MKKFTNIGKMMEPISFSDGSTIYLRSGESTESNLAALDMSTMVTVEEIQIVKSKVKAGD